MLRTDALRVKQVLINLIDNSIKFTPAGGTVSVRAHLQEDGQFAIAVEDTGIGISSEEMETALSPFGQIDCDLNRKYEGTGLGLSISKRLAGLLGADFTIESQSGRGTTVTLRFPQERVCESTSEMFKAAQKLAS